MTLSNLDGFIVRGESPEGIELRGANAYRLPEPADALVVIPAFPPLFYSGSLCCRDGCLRWFIDADRNIYMIDFGGGGAVLIDGDRAHISATSFISSINACISFFEWLELEVKRIGRDDDAFTQVMIAINDDDSWGLPQWLIEAPSFGQRWSEYKAHYKDLRTAETYYRAGYLKALDSSTHGRESIQLFLEWSAHARSAMSEARVNDCRDAFVAGYRKGRADYDKSDFHC